MVQQKQPVWYCIADTLLLSYFYTMSEKTKHYGLIGYPLSHTFSKKYFTEKFEKEKIDNAVYDVFPIENIKDLPKLLEDNPDLCGLKCYGTP